MIRLSWLEDIAVATIDNPPVNASTHGVRSALLDTLRRLEASGTLAGVIVTGAGKTFVAGSDIKEFGAPIADPQLPEVLHAIEQFPFPVVAAINGLALGGGLELSLACDLRVATADAIVGLPEVTLGLVPGAGGTQRLPRFVGIAAAIELAATGKRIHAPKALELGLVDAIAGDDLLATAVTELRKLTGKRRAAERPLPGFDADAVDAAIRKARASSKGRPAAEKTIELVLRSADIPLEEGLRLERRVFNEIRVTPEAAAYRHLFFAERKASKAPSAASALPIRSVAVIGSGTMGTGIAYSFAAAGFEVALIDSQAEAIERARTRFGEIKEGDLRAGRVTREEAEAAAARLTTSTDIVSAAGKDLVVEAVFEDREVKREVLSRLGEIVGLYTIIATNTSYLDIDEIGAQVPRTERLLGLHFFAPANVMKLVEVVRAAHTSDETVATGLAVAKRLGKQPVVAKNAFGFIGNRIYAAYRRHAEFLVMDGASPADVDAAMRGFGMAMGPFAVADLSGLDIAWRMRQSRRHLRRPDERYIDIPDRLCEAGRLGRKTGGGYFDYVDGRPAPSDAVAEVIEQARKDAGIDARAIDADEIVARCVGAMVNEAAHVMAERVAMRPSDIDVVLAHGYGFPRWQGGLTWWCSRLSQTQRQDVIDRVARAEGVTFQRADLGLLAIEN